ncbi:MAG: hypothetical protein H0W89_08210, partial [Candidatus Levybacteria bacterium]|nr:hypothetical protein [Candidatus Levybacteria bacterium]
SQPEQPNISSTVSTLATTSNAVVTSSSGFVTSRSILEKLRPSQPEQPNISSTVSQPSAANPVALSTSAVTKGTTVNYSAAQKEAMINELLSKFPKVEPKVLYLALRHYDFNISAFYEGYNKGKVDFISLEKRYLLEEYSTVKKRLDELDLAEKTKNEVPIQHEIATNEKEDPDFVPPTYWEQKKYSISHFNMVDVTLHSEEGLEILNRFFENDIRSRQLFAINKITRIENASLVKSYTTKKSIMDAKNKISNELTLFHGCAEGGIPKIAQEGFDTRVASFKGAAGIGTYFAQYPRTSLSYIRDCPSNAMKILLCRVQLGVQTTFEELNKAFPHSSPFNPIRRPQARSSTDSTPFDSAYGNMLNNPSNPIHVIYDNNQALPEYIIEFSIAEERLVRGPRPTVPNAIRWDHPRYKAQLEETKKSLPFLKRTINHESNWNKPSYVFLQKLCTILEQNPDDPNSIHQQDNMTLDSLQLMVRYYNSLCAKYPLLYLPEGDSFEEFLQAMPTSSNTK